MRHGLIYRHGRIVRIAHWLNAFAVFGLLVTAFGITQLCAPLHWGDAGQDWGKVGEEFNGAGVDPWPAIARVPSLASNPKLASADEYLRKPMRVRDHIAFAWLFLCNGLRRLSRLSIAGLARFGSWPAREASRRSRRRRKPR